MGIFRPDGPYYYGALSVLLVTVVSLVFYLRSDVSFWVVVIASPLSIIPGVSIYIFERYLQKIQTRLEMSGGRIQALFLILFAYLLGYIVISTLLFIYPMGLLINHFADEMIIDQYGQWMINMAIAVSLVSWFRCLLRSGTN